MSVKPVTARAALAGLVSFLVIGLAVVVLRSMRPRERISLHFPPPLLADESRERQILRTVIRGLQHRESLLKSCSAYFTLVGYSPKKSTDDRSLEGGDHQIGVCDEIEQWFWAFQGVKCRLDQRIVWPEDRPLYWQRAFDGDRYYQYDVLGKGGYVGRMSQIRPFEHPANCFYYRWGIKDRPSDEVPLSELLTQAGGELWLVRDGIAKEGRCIVVGYRFPVVPAKDYLEYLQFEFSVDRGMYPQHVDWMMCQTAKAKSPGAGRLVSKWASDLINYSDVWLPKSVIVEYYDLMEGKVIAWRGSYLLQVHDIRVNEPFIGTPFALEFPIGAIVGDEDTGWMAHTVGGEIDVEALAKSTGPPPHWKVGDQPVSVPQQFSWKEIK